MEDWQKAGYGRCEMIEDWQKAGYGICERIGRKQAMADGISNFFYNTVFYNNFFITFFS